MKSRSGIIEIFPLGTELIVYITQGKPNNVHLTALKGKFTQKLGYLLGYPNLYDFISSVEHKSFFFFL